jgi:hypothetical protein
MSLRSSRRLDTRAQREFGVGATQQTHWEAPFPHMHHAGVPHRLLVRNACTNGQPGTEGPYGLL